LRYLKSIRYQNRRWFWGSDLGQERIPKTATYELTSMHKDELSIILKRLDTLQRTVDITNHDMEEDRGRIENLEVRQGKIEILLQAIHDAWVKQTRKIMEEVKESVGNSVPKAVDDAVSESLDKYVETQKPQQSKQKKSFWQRIGLKR